MFKGLDCIQDFASVVLCSSLFLGLIGCQPKRPTPVAKIDYAAPLPEGQLALRKISPLSYPDFSRSLGRANVAELRRSVMNSLAYLGRPSSNAKYPYLDISHERAAATLRAMLALIDARGFEQPPAEFNRLIGQQFEVYQSVGASAPEGGYTNQVLFTGYFTPTYDASLTRAGAFQWPIYKRPADLVSDESGDSAFRKMADGSTTIYPARREVESGMLAGQELAWVSSRWNAYVITVQGSARLRLADGRIMEVGYAGSNGREYSSPGMRMVADGAIARADLNFESMRRYFDVHPEAMDRYLWINPRTVFFAERAGGPFGSLNVPVTRFATIATDKAVYPPAMPAFVLAPGAASPLANFVLDQDRGGAIRSAGRCDIYMGIGDSAEQMSGRQLSTGALYYLAVKPDLVSQFAK